jgi:plasmid maintenance system antidote protein VapI
MSTVIGYHADMSQTVSEQLRAAIIASGLSHNALAALTGVTQPAISRFVSGDRGLTTDSLDKLADFLGLSLSAARPRRKAPRW